MASCSWVSDFGGEEPENTIANCIDGADNDLDGLTDCADDDCRCNRCGTPLPEIERDVFGVLCERDCECPGMDVCVQGQNLSRGRCIEPPRPEGEGFDVRFRLELDAMNGSSPTDRQLVRGRASQVELRDVAFDAVLWRSFDLTFVGRPVEAPAGTGSQGLAVFTVPSLEPAVTGTVSTAFFDDEIVARPRDRQTFRALAGPFASPDNPLEGIVPRAVVLSSTLTYQRRVEDGMSVLEGRFRGSLRASTNFDEARNDPCGNREFYPDGGACFTRERLRDEIGGLFVLGCQVGAETPVRGGEMRYFWNRFWDGAGQQGFDGGCGARATPNGVEVRAVTIGRGDNSWLMKIDIDEDRLNFGTSVCLSEDGITATVHRLFEEPRLDARLFEIELESGLESLRFDGRIFVDVFDRGADPRFFAWIDGQRPCETPE
jgi:hypothetical protein